MTRQPLPMNDPARTEFGFARTVCACPACTQYCHYLPGYLVPADLERIQHQVSPGEDLHVWARQHLLASPGALVMRQGQMVRIRTLVPARQADGSCIFLDDANRCAIHAVAPFGCAFFDAQMSPTESDRRSKCGLRAVLQAWQAGDHYARLWVELAGAGFVAPPPEVARGLLHQAEMTYRPQ